MHNLLLDDWSAPQIEEVLVRHPRKPLLPPLGSEEWRRAAANPTVHQWLNGLRGKAQEEWNEPLPVLTDELYAGFRQTGVRLDFERVYGERRLRLARAVISLLLSREEDPWRQRLAASAVAKLTSIFEEVSWALPAHVNWDNDDLSGKDPLQIDLASALTANLMGELLDLLGGIIPAPLQERIRERLRTDIFENYLNRPFHWKEVNHNWNAVCHEGVIGAALSQLDNPGLLSHLLVSARRGLQLFLSGFSRDGGCEEGPSYWNYGFGCFVALNEQLEARTAGELSLFEGNDRIREIARYGPRMSLPGGHLVNFADSSATGGLSPFLLSYLGERLSDPECSLCAQQGYQRLAGRELHGNTGHDDLYLFALVRLFLRCPENLSGMSPVDSAVGEDCFLPDLGVLVAHGTDGRGHRWDVAAKAGHNGEHHNHNDCGSYIVNIDELRLITEIGAPGYVHDFFQPGKRYGFLAARTLGHSLPIINGFEQAAGAAHASRVSGHSLEQDQVKFVVDATLCYPAEAGCRKFVRSLEFNKGLGSLVVEDVFELDRLESLESALITFQPLSIHGEDAFIEWEAVKLVLRPTPGTRLDRVETHSYFARDGKESSVRRLVLKPCSLTPTVRISLEIFTSDSSPTL